MGVNNSNVDDARWKDEARRMKDKRQSQKHSKSTLRTSELMMQHYSKIFSLHPTAFKVVYINSVQNYTGILLHMCSHHILYALNLIKPLY